MPARRRPLTVPQLLSLLRAPGLLLASLLAATAPAADEGYVGTARCASCHEAAYTAWRGSHHDLAMQRPDAGSVLGDFDNARFEHFGVRTEFYTRDGRYLVRTDGPDGAPTEYEVAWVFGVYPLQQYLLPLADGRLQALSVAWDSRPAKDGGQRWYHLYPGEAIAHDDPLHWTGPYQNWNTRCAECHSTNVRKNYDATTRRFDTTFFEEDVGCEGCHGPGADHVRLAEVSGLPGAPRAGFPVSLAARGDWSFAPGEAIATRRTPLAGREQIDTCGRCHARRATLGDYRHGQPLADTHRLALLGEPLYHADGQILDEVYVYGSFLQSRMQRAGVVCSNCHEPHSNQLRAEGNAVCAQCHAPARYDAVTHHRHAAGEAGSHCVDCHMPATPYMGVDDRRDHAMRIPRPDLSLMAGTPNACNGCHSGESADWALAALREWGVEFRASGDHPAVAMAALARGDARGVPTLLALAQDADAAAIWRATALERSAAAGSREALQLARGLLGSPDPLLRVSAVRSLGALPLQQRHAVLAPLAADPIAGVRLEVAQALAGMRPADLAAGGRDALLAVFDEYRAVHREHADMPGMNLELGLFNLARGDYPGAEMAYREALAINPQLLPARLNLADLLRAAGRDGEARRELELALASHPDNGDAMHALGLLEARAGNRDAALTWLGKAAARETAGSRHRFVYAVAQHDFGDLRGALRSLAMLHAALPGDEQTLLALANYSAESGDLAAARRYADRLLEIAPDNGSYRRLRMSLGS